MKNIKIIFGKACNNEHSFNKLRKEQLSYLMENHFKKCEERYSKDLDKLFYRIFSIICGEQKESFYLVEKNIEDLNFRKIQTLKVFSLYLETDLIMSCTDLEYFEICENILIINTIIKKGIINFENNLIS